jgi:integrase
MVHLNEDIFMAIDKLTDTMLRGKATKPREKTFKLSDGHGLYLEIRPDGKRYWRHNYRYNGKQKTLAHGVYPETSLAEARDKRTAARKLLRAGIDPSKQKKADKANKTNVFKSIAKEWFDSQCEDWEEGHAKKVWHYLEVDIFPHIGDEPIAQITTPQLLDVLRRVEKRGAYDIVSRLRQRCEAIFKYAVLTERAAFNPATQLQGVFKKRKVVHQKALGRKELPKFMDGLNHYSGHPVTKLATEMLAHTFVRTGELRFAKWEEFNLEECMWLIPAERMKKGNDHLVPLTARVLEMLEELRDHNGNREFVFASPNKPKQALSENAVTNVLYRMGYKGKATGHGFRSTASTILNEMGYNRDAIERQLAHVERNQVRAAYNRSEYLEERKKIMADWSKYLLSLSDNVVPISTRYA